jgi:uncharacterized protein YndB with AHSA1/START domain
MPTATVTFTQTIDASAGRLWRVFTDLAGRPDWLCTVDRVEVLTPGPFGPGTSWRESRTLPDGTLLTEELLVREADPPLRLVVASAGVGAHYRTTYLFRPMTAPRHGGSPGTEVTVVHEGIQTARYGRLLAVVFGGLAARAVENVLRRDLADLATAVAGPASAGPPVAA